MDFNELKRTYKLDFDGLAKILKKQHITLNLAHLNAIPDNWIPIIEESLGIVTSKEDKEEVNDIANENLQKKKNRC